MASRFRKLGVTTLGACAGAAVAAWAINANDSPYKVLLLPYICIGSYWNGRLNICECMLAILLYEQNLPGSEITNYANFSSRLLRMLPLQRLDRSENCPHDQSKFRYYRAVKSTMYWSLVAVRPVPVLLWTRSHEA